MSRLHGSASKPLNKTLISFKIKGRKRKEGISIRSLPRLLLLKRDKWRALYFAEAEIPDAR